MEDTHIAEPNLTSDISLFAVFDGHGGSLLLYNTFFIIQKKSIR